MTDWSRRPCAGGTARCNQIRPTGILGGITAGIVATEEREEER
jgi:hypothetical protein